MASGWGWDVVENIQDLVWGKGVNGGAEWVGTSARLLIRLGAVCAGAKKAG